MNPRAGLTPPADRSQGGRPLDGTRDGAILQATVELLAEQGYDRLTVEAVAARIHAGKATVYRRWASKAELVIDALNAITCPASLPETGSLRGDLGGLCGIGGPEILDEFGTEIMRGLACALPHDEELAKAFQEHFVRPRTALMREAFQRAQDRGEIAEGRDLDLLSTVFPALMMHRKLARGQAPDAAYRQRVIDEVLLPLALGPTPTSAEPDPPEGAR